MWVRSLGWEDSLEEEMATHSSILAWKIPWTEKPGELQSMGWQRNGHDWATQYKTWHHKTPRKEHRHNTLCINHSSIFLDQSPKAKEIKIQFSSVSQSCLTLRSQRLQHSRLPCPLPSPRVCSNSYQLSQWCHPGISFSDVPFSSCLRSCPVSGSFTVSQLFASAGQSIGAPALASVLPVNIQGWFPLGLTSLISLWRRQWHPTPVLLPGKSHGWRSLVGCSPWGHKELDTTERLNNV